MAELTCSYSIAKGMKEPCDPFREDYVFGADMNDFNADDWNCFPIAWDATTNYNLSLINPNKEVVVAFVKVTSDEYGSYTVNFKWYRDDRPGVVLYEYEIEFDDWKFYAYSYIGWFAGEITANGNYHVDIVISGDGSDSATKNFTVTGISPLGEAGHIWVYQTWLCYLDEAGKWRSGTGLLTGQTGTPGHVWVEGTYLHFIDANMDERRVEGVDMGYVSGSVPGHLWIDMGCLYYIDSSSYKRRLEWLIA